MNRLPNEVPASLKTIDVKAILRRRGVYLQQEANRNLKEAAIPIARKLFKSRQQPTVVKQTKPRHQQFSDEQVLAFWEKQIHVVEILEKKFDLKLQQFINKVVHGFLNTLETEINNKKWKAKDYFDDAEADLLAQAQFDFTPLLIDQAVLAGQEAYKLIGVDDIYTPFALRKQIEQNVTKFTQSMLDTDRQKLIDIVTAGIQEGKSVPEIRGTIQADFESYSKMQSQRVTRTEVLRASNQATLDAYQQSGVVEGKQWLTAGAVDECADYEGQIEALDGNFYEGTSDFADGDPPLHPNCRCVLLPVLIGEKAFAPQPNKALHGRIVELEAQIDKRTKAYRDLKDQRADDTAYIKSLEKYLGLDGPAREA